ncbi:MAG: type II secretion system protein [Verrucomicrobiales bacterium]|nr:type II secretion system protein [Verrucomicrobiales bacterium]
MKRNANQNSAFSLVEVLAAVGIIGIIAFLAIPNIVAIKEDSERQLAITRAEGINMGVAAYIQANGRDVAAASWPTGTSTEEIEERYTLIRPYLSFAPTTLAEFQPAGYVITPPADLTNLVKSELKVKDGSAFSY